MGTHARHTGRGESELSKEFAEHPLHMTNRLLFAASSAAGMNYSRCDINMLTPRVGTIVFFRSSFTIVSDTNHVGNIYSSPHTRRRDLAYLSFADRSTLRDVRPVCAAVTDESFIKIHQIHLKPKQRARLD